MTIGPSVLLLAALLSNAPTAAAEDATVFPSQACLHQSEHGQINLRAAAGLRHEIVNVEQLQPPEVTVLGANHAWRLIRAASGKVGWVHGSWIIPCAKAGDVLS